MSPPQPVPPTTNYLSQSTSTPNTSTQRRPWVKLRRQLSKLNLNLKLHNLRRNTSRKDPKCKDKDAGTQHDDDDAAAGCYDASSLGGGRGGGGGREVRFNAFSNGGKDDGDGEVEAKVKSKVEDIENPVGNGRYNSKTKENIPHPANLIDTPHSVSASASAPTLTLAFPSDESHPQSQDAHEFCTRSHAPGSKIFDPATTSFDKCYSQFPRRNATLHFTRSMQGMAPFAGIEEHHDCPDDGEVEGSSVSGGSGSGGRGGDASGGGGGGGKARSIEGDITKNTALNSHPVAGLFRRGDWKNE